MSAVKPAHIEKAGRWLVILVMVLTLKQFYSAAQAAQLQWMLYPLVLMLELLSDMSFQLMPDYAWIDAAHQVGIVKGCAGINFLIISLLAYLWLRRDQALSFRMLLRAFLAAWLSALCANALRVLLSVYGQSGLAEMAGISDEDSHRAIGIVVYFLCLWGQVSIFNVQSFRQKTATTLMIYFGMTLLFPYCRAWLLGLDLPKTTHVLWVLGLPSTIVLLSLLVRRYRFRYRASS